MPGAADSTSINDCHNEANVRGTKEVGGIIGYNGSGNISNCVNNNKIYTNTNYGGGIVGYNNGGSISYCTNYNEVEAETNLAGGITGYCAATATNVTECENRGNVKAKGYMAGGIIGRNRENIVITNCRNYGEISADKSLNGGIVGYSVGGVSYCANYGKIVSSSIAANPSKTFPNSVGGIIGCLLNGEVEYVYNEGEISIQNNSEKIDVAGGIIGELGGATADSMPIPSVRYSYNKGKVVSDEYVGNIVGQELYENRVTYSYYLSSLSGKGIGYIGSDILNYNESLIQNETNVTEDIPNDFSYEEFINWINNGGN